MILEIIILTLLQISMIVAVEAFSDQKIKNIKLLIISIIIYDLLYYYLLKYIPAELNTIVSILYTTILIKILLKLNNKNLLFYMIIIWILGIMVDIGTMLAMNFTNVTSRITDLNKDFFKSISTIIMITFYFVCAHSKYIKSKILKLKRFTQKINISYYVFIALLIIYFTLGAVCLNEMNNIESIIFILFIAITCFIIFIIFIVQQFQIISLKESVHLLDKNSEFYIKLIDEYRILKHNLIGNLNGVKTVGNKKTKILIDDLIKEYSSILKLPKNFKEIPTGISGLIYEKIYSTNNKELKIKIENKLKHNIIEVLTARKYNLICEALSVTLDNALEATIKSKEKIIYLEFIEDEENIYFKIINTFTGNIDIDKLGTKNYTSKKYGHGLGLFSILIKKDITLATSIKDNKFINVVTVQK